MTSQKNEIRDETHDGKPAAKETTELPIFRIVEETIEGVLDFVLRFFRVVWQIARSRKAFVEKLIDTPSEPEHALLRPYSFLFVSTSLLYFSIRISSFLEIGLDVERLVSFWRFSEISLRDLVFFITPTMALVIVVGIILKRIASAPGGVERSTVRALFCYICGFNFAIASFMFLLFGLLFYAIFFIVRLLFSGSLGMGGFYLAMILIPLAVSIYLLCRSILLVLSGRKILVPDAQRMRSFFFILIGIIGSIVTFSFGMWNAISPLVGDEIISARVINQETIQEGQKWKKDISILMQNNKPYTFIIRHGLHRGVPEKVIIWRNSDNKKDGYFANSVNIISSSSSSMGHVFLKPGEATIVVIRITPFGSSREGKPHWPGDKTAIIKDYTWLNVKEITVNSFVVGKKEAEELKIHL